MDDLADKFKVCFLQQSARIYFIGEDLVSHLGHYCIALAKESSQHKLGAPMRIVGSSMA
jgi:hypothetical protein